MIGRVCSPAVGIALMLTLMGGCGSSPSAPQAYLAIHYHGPDHIVCNGISSRAPNGGWIASYRWDFGDGSPVHVSGDHLQEHRYQQPGVYTIRLTVCDEQGRIAIKERGIHIRARLPPFGSDGFLSPNEACCLLP